MSQEKAVSSDFIDHNLITELAKIKAPENNEFQEIIAKARELKGLSPRETASLLAVDDPDQAKLILDTAEFIKETIYGKRVVLFAPLYTGNFCTNNCLYCGFRSDNRSLKRIKLNKDNLIVETKALLAEGHKRLLMLCGESEDTPLANTIEAIETVYSVKSGKDSIRRINVEIAPMEVAEFRELKKANIGTYACFQETYNRELYKKYHPKGKKADYDYRLQVMHRAMEGEIDDVGIGVLFGLADYRYEVLSILFHALDLEKRYGCGPHTVSVPRIEPAPEAPLADNIPFPVSDDEFRKIIAIIRIAMPYTGIILSTRENARLRKELLHYGVSQISAGSKTEPGAYSQGKELTENSQFLLGDHRSLDEVIYDLVNDGYVPSFCTGCYRQGRVGNDFMDLAKPGLIKKFCLPNALFSFAEYLNDFASKPTRDKGFELIEKMAVQDVPESRKDKVRETLAEIKGGKRDLYL